MRLPQRRRAAELWAVTALVLAAFALRVADLAARSLWGDESATLGRIQHSWADVFSNAIYVGGIRTIEPHPPLFFAALKTWSAAAGDSDFALKFAVVFGGVCLVPLSYVLSRKLFGSTGGLIGALLAASSPAYQWYAQELRHYTLSAGLGVLAAYLVCRAVAGRRDWRAWLGWILATAAGIATHYLNAGLLAGQVAVLGWLALKGWIGSGRRGLALAAVAIAATVGGVAAWAAWPRLAPLAGNAAAMLAARGLEPLLAYVQLLVGGSLYGLNASDPTGGLLIWLAALLALPGVWLTARRPAGALAVLPAIFMLLAVSTLQSALVAYRYVMLLTPALYLALTAVIVQAARPAVTVGAGNRMADPAAGQGTHRVATLRGSRLIRRTLPAGLLAGLLAIQLFGTLSVFIPTPTWQDDWRSLARHIRAHWLPGDVILNASPITAYEAIDKYLADLPARVTQINTLPVGEAAQARVRDHYRRVWFINTGGADLAIAGGGLLQPFHLRERLSFAARTNILELALLETQPPFTVSLPGDALVLEDAPADAGTPRLIGVTLAAGSPYADRPNFLLSAYWQRGAGAPRDDYRLNARLVGAGADWLAFRAPAQLDMAGGGWGEDAVYRVDYLVDAPLGLPDLPYSLELRVTAGSKDEAVQAAVAAIDQPLARSALRFTAWPAGQASPAAWEGADARLLSVEHPADARPGESVPVALTWSLTRPPATGWTTRLAVEGLLGGVVVTDTAAAGWDAFPVPRWPLGEPVRDVRSILLPNTIAPGVYRITLERAFEGGRPAEGTPLGWLTVRDYEFSRLPDAPAVAVDGRVGEMALLGYRLDQPLARGVPLSLHTYWRVDAKPSQDGVLFAHLYGPDGKLAAQDDSPPERGRRSTQTYRPGEGIRQLHQLILPPDAPAGAYHLYAGIYNRGDAQRWPASLNGNPARDDLVYLGDLTLK
jgi:hypothetical protein